jgi:hypothetical protein
MEHGTGIERRAGNLLKMHWMGNELITQPSVTVNIVFGHVELDERYIQTGDNSVECQCRKRVYDGEGALVETSEWSPISSAINIPDEYMLHLIGAEYKPAQVPLWRRLFSWALHE